MQLQMEKDDFARETLRRSVSLSNLEGAYKNALKLQENLEKENSELQIERTEQQKAMTKLKKENANQQKTITKLEEEKAVLQQKLAAYASFDAFMKMQQENAVNNAVAEALMKQRAATEREKEVAREAGRDEAFRGMANACMEEGPEQKSRRKKARRGTERR
ncbi:Oidioi.mRNA.OKI2018_I69.chr1.g404.t1.cds [Oikopleura dioica]|uniref:Oidioi.mRNA.OKI2018_I69.chr1.g404.t1.cds n=1 Tax=Oikopleura dioica TaxID=34765 RepID=A0ABN7SPY4_OIKDI|nr:Oidioi.mRNA.OKI2018_I69.chr1.g404.t1.cds [Oikopleura dioica]